MAKYIELIDKYKVVHSDDDDTPTSYTWVDNTGEIVRCGECKHRYDGECPLSFDNGKMPDDWFCADGEREAQDESAGSL